ncbi:MAG: VCBS repeat-containing protein [Ferruginibacter sp.]|nr:VCBS repeat-containing protein [Ferruginibacter sp.]
MGRNPSEMYRCPLVVTDVDNDGLQDVVASLGGYPQVFGCNQKNGKPRLKLSGTDNIQDRKMNYGALAIGDITGDGLADHVVFQAELNKVDYVVSCSGNEYCMALTLYKGIKNGGELVFEGRESPNSPAKLAEERRQKAEAERAAELAAARNNSSNSQTTTSKTETVEPKNLKRGIALYKGRSKDGLAIEVEADVLYEDKAPNGMAGFKYKHIYKAVTRRFRYPTTNNRWISFSGYNIDSDINNGNNIWISGMQFFLNEPGIN